MFFRVSNLIQTFQTDIVESSNQYSTVIEKSFSTDYPVSFHLCCTSVLYQLSILTMIYIILGFELLSPIFLVAISTNCRPASHQSILCILDFSPFLTKCTVLEMCIICLVSLSLLAIHIADLISNIIRCASSISIYGSFFYNSFINILIFSKAISVVQAALYSLSELD